MTTPTTTTPEIKTMTKVYTCRICGASFTPRKGAKRAYYCSQACNQKNYNNKLKAERRREALTITPTEAEHYQKMLDVYPFLDRETDKIATLHGNESALSAIKLIAKIGENYQ